MNKFIRFIVDPKFRCSILASRGWYNSMSDEDYIKRKYKLSFGKELNLDSPQTYNEKLQWLKLNYRKPIMTAMVDKYEVKNILQTLLARSILFRH